MAAHRQRRPRIRNCWHANNQGVGYADYVLWGYDGKPLAVIEAKRIGRNPHEGQQQAKLYADALEAKFGQRPVIFTINSYEHWICLPARRPVKVAVVAQADPRQLYESPSLTSRHLDQSRYFRSSAPIG
ncbi:hypothetical protein L2449_09430 [Mesorhizobium muleiense]|uniref:hypothetical protein n=1 Tax=Mesorhizobium muleiense TaxID=1004279 RepID=UPI001F2578CF|nr:hypothetical protein [Mesorhizobium muleiense]MCF6117134.1 hypothetical protein [Mesorhizobium muleiense]